MWLELGYILWLVDIDMSVMLQHGQGVSDTTIVQNPNMRAHLNIHMNICMFNSYYVLFAIYRWTNPILIKWSMK